MNHSYNILLHCIQRFNSSLLHTPNIQKQRISSYVYMSDHSYVYNINEKDSFEPAYLVKTNIETQPEINSANNTL